MWDQKGYLTPNDDYETAAVILDKGASKRDLARRMGVARSTVRKVANNLEIHVGHTTSQHIETKFAVRRRR